MDRMYIQVERERITTLIEKVKNGIIAIPRFQRDYIWSNGQVIDFFDSILHGWPIGALLLWSPTEERFNVVSEIEGIDIPEKNTSDVTYILDGRQRITTLVSVLCQEAKPSSRYYVNLDDMQVICTHVSSDKKYNLLQLADAYDTFALVEYLDRLRNSGINANLIASYAEKAKEVNKLLLNYEIGTIKVNGGDIDSAVQIFSRLNSKNTPVSADYMIQALAYSPKTDFLFADSITQIKQDLSIYNLSDIKRDIILKCAYSHTDKPFIDAHAEDLCDLRDSLQNIMQEVADEIMAAAKFLSDYCGLVDCLLLPYNYQFIMCALFFKYNTKPSDNMLQELRRWFFYTAYTSYFTNTSLGVIREDLVRFTKFCKHETESPIDYDLKWTLSELPASSSLGAVRNCIFVLSNIVGYSKKIDLESSRFSLCYAPNTVRTIDRAFICLSDDQKKELNLFLKRKVEWTPSLEEHFQITKDMAALYEKGEYDKFTEYHRLHMKRNEEIFITNVLKYQLTLNDEIDSQISKGKSLLNSYKEQSILGQNDEVNEDGYNQLIEWVHETEDVLTSVGMCDLSYNFHEMCMDDFGSHTLHNCMIAVELGINSLIDRT